MKKLLITGGSGYIGNLTIPFLKEEGYQVDNYDIVNDPQDDIFNEERLTKRLKGKDIVYHLVAIPHPHKGNEVDYRKINYEGSKTVFLCAKIAKVKKFIFASSGCVYGFWGGHAKPDRLPISEDNSIPTLEEGQTLYGYFKIAFEKYLQKESQRAGIRSISLRLEGVNPKPATSSTIHGKFLQEHRPEEKSCKLWHFLGSCSVENYQQLLKLVIENDLDSHFDVFNVGNEHVHPSIDVQKLIKENWPNIPNQTKDNEVLYSIKKAKRLLGYKPTTPKEYSESETKTEKNSKTLENPKKGFLVRFYDLAKRNLS